MKLIKESGGITKVIALHTKKGIEEIENTSFLKDVYPKIKGKDIDVYLYRYDSGPLGIGVIFTSKAYIGNAKNNLTADDYYRAYDEII